jgi:hypothetical protein
VTEGDFGVKMNKKNEAKLKSVRGDEKTADEWVDLARGTEDNEKRVRYCSNALKLDPQNEDAWCGVVGAIPLL